MKGGRKRGGTNRPRASAALLAVTKFPSENGERPSAVQTLRRLLAQYNALAETARRAHDLGNYKFWSKRASDAATTLASYEAPKLAATMALDAPAETVDFELRIFDRQRRPLLPPVVERASRTIDVTPNKEPVRKEQQRAAAEPNTQAKPEPPSKPEPPPVRPYVPGVTVTHVDYDRQPRSVLEHPAIQMSMWGFGPRGGWRGH